MIIQFPDQKLDQISVSAIDNLSLEERESLCSEMRKACWEVNGFGISAIQIGEPYRIMGVFSPSKNDLVWFFDLAIRSGKGKKVFTEGCLSIPGYFWDVKRYDTIGVSYKDKYGVHYYKRFSGIESRVIQHEVDHFDGLLIPDALSDNDYESFQSHYLAKKNPSSYDAPRISMI